MSSTINNTIGVMTTPGEEEKEFVFETVVKSTYRGVSEKEARELHVASMNIAMEMNVPATNGGAGTESGSDMPAANGGAGVEEYDSDVSGANGGADTEEYDAPEECERETLTFRVWNARAGERMEISVDGVPFKVFTAMLCGNEMKLWDSEKTCLVLDEEHKRETLSWMERNGFPMPQKKKTVDIKRTKLDLPKVGKFIAIPAVLGEHRAVIHSKSIDFGTRKVAGKNVRAIFADGHWLAFDEVAWVSSGVAFRGRKGTWVLAHPETIQRVTRFLIDTGLCPELKKRKGTWVQVSAP